MARANIHNKNNLVIFIFVISVEYEINFSSKISRTKVYHFLYIYIDIYNYIISYIYITSYIYI